MPNVPGFWLRISNWAYHAEFGLETVILPEKVSHIGFQFPDPLLVNGEVGTLSV